MTVPKKKKPAPAVARRKRRSADDILNRIVLAATDEFKRSGFAGATTAAIARKADVTEAQLFRYFGSKANLFNETIFKPLDQHFLNFIEQIPDGGKVKSHGEMVHLYTTELQRFIGEHSKMLASLVAAQTYQSGPAHGASTIESLDTYFDHGAAFMTKRLKGEPKVDPKLMVRVSFVAVLACVMFKDWIFPRGLASDAAITKAINDFIMDGLNANSSKD